MKDKIFGVLQRVGRSFMLPIAILPVAGLLLGIGSSFTNATTIATYGLEGVLGNGTILHSLLVIMNHVGSAIFDNLPLIFAIGVAIGMAKKEKEVSALSAVIAYYVMNTAINAMLQVTGKILADGSVTESGVSLLIHVGLDTVKLKGEGFEILQEMGSKVKKGTPILKLDLEYLEKNAPSLATPVLCTELEDNQKIRLLKTGEIKAGEPLFAIDTFE